HWKIAETRSSIELRNLLIRLFPNAQSIVIENYIRDESLIAPHLLFALLDHWKSKLTTLSLGVGYGFPDCQVENLCNRINEMDHLKHFSLYWRSQVMPVLNLLPTLARLERFRLTTYEIFSAENQLVTLFR